LPDWILFIVSGGNDGCAYSFISKIYTDHALKANFTTDSDDLREKDSDIEILSGAGATRLKPGVTGFRCRYGLATDGSEDHGDFPEDGVYNIMHYLFGLGYPREGVTNRLLLPRLGAASNQYILSYVPETTESLAGAILVILCWTE